MSWLRRYRRRVKYRAIGTWNITDDRLFTEFWKYCDHSQRLRFFIFIFAIVFILLTQDYDDQGNDTTNWIPPSQKSIGIDSGLGMPNSRIPMESMRIESRLDIVDIDWIKKVNFTKTVNEMKRERVNRLSFNGNTLQDLQYRGYEWASESQANKTKVDILSLKYR